jgi:RNA polymerase sigma-70 factor, ECF subfamily
MIAALSTPAHFIQTPDSAADRLFWRVAERDDYVAFRELFVLLYAPLVRQATRFVHAPTIAEEVVADVFIRIWKNRADISIHSSIRAYLQRAVRNQSLDYLKSVAHTADSHDELPLFVIDCQTDGDSPETALEQHEFAERVEAVVAGLPAQCQAVFRLSRDRGLKYREIADELNLSIKTVETHMGRAFRVLRESLAAYRE